MSSQANVDFVLIMTCFGSKSNIRFILILMSGIVAFARKLSEQRSSLINILKIGTRILWIIAKEDAWQIYAEHFTAI